MINNDSSRGGKTSCINNECAYSVVVRPLRFSRLFRDFRDGCARRMFTLKLGEKKSVCFPASRPKFILEKWRNYFRTENRYGEGDEAREGKTLWIFKVFVWAEKPVDVVIKKASPRDTDTDLEKGFCFLLGTSSTAEKY